MVGRSDTHRISEMLRQAYLNPVKLDQRIAAVRQYTLEYANRLSGSPYTHVESLCRLMVRVIDTTKAVSPQGNDTVILLLAQAIDLAWDDDAKTQRYITEIVRLVQEKLASIERQC